MKILVMMSRQPACILLGFCQRPGTLAGLDVMDKLPRQELGSQGMMAVFKVPLPSISWIKTLGKLPSCSSACTNAAAVTPRIR